MRLSFFLIAVLLVVQTTVAQPVVSIIPQPVKLELKNGTFVIDQQTAIRYKDRNLKGAAELLSSTIRSISGIELNQKSTDKKLIVLMLANDAELGNEGYKLSVKPEGVIIKANRYAGVVYGIQSLLQTLPAIRTNAQLQVPCMEVTDYPRFAWRGMHLDVSRHFFSPEVIKEYIDLMAAYKMNTFHWHLVDDQGWRIEIKKYPNLTQVGAWRVDKLDTEWRSRAQAKEGEPATYGGYYTQDQIKNIVAYAQQRNVTIVPEIEMPGHSAAVLASYPKLSCTQQPQLPMTGGNYTNMASNFCAGNDESFQFLQDVLTEVIELFPSAYVHIGGDEVEKDSWKKCIRCQARIKSENLKNEDELQSYFIKRIEKFLISKNKKIIGWDEILEGGLAPQAAVMSWRGETGGIEAAKMNHDVVMTPGVPCYFDHYQDDPATEPIAIGGFNSLKRVYDYEPVPKELNEQQAKHVLGAQANLWTEWISTPEHLEYMILPRLLALAEVVWSPGSTKDWNNFNERLRYHFKGFDQKGLHHSKGNFKVEIKPIVRDKRLYASLFSEAYHAEIFYTTDGTIPTTSSQKYTSEIYIDSSLTIKAIAYTNIYEKSAKPSEQSFAIHKAVGDDVVYEYPVSKYYKADGPNTLTDGIRGTTSHDKNWLGFNDNDLMATIDLGETKSIHRVSIGCLQNYRAWIFMPQSVKVEISADGKSFIEVGIISNKISSDEKNSVINDFVVEFKQQKIKSIRVTAKRNICPKGHSGEGQPAWLFADEVVVE
ncbi:MAG: family 20 glycosylhydrolase [Bacteroidetes bacterium]|nr:family 20 glycosylhydrolase [Bacteroidota bacterium]